LRCGNDATDKTIEVEDERRLRENASFEEKEGLWRWGGGDSRDGNGKEEEGNDQVM
jgi:hypothetical protein